MAKRRRKSPITTNLLSEQVAWLGTNADRHLTVEVNYNSGDDNFAAVLRVTSGGAIAATGPAASTIGDALENLADELASQDPDEILVGITKRSAPMAGAPPWEDLERGHPRPPRARR